MNWNMDSSLRVLCGSDSRFRLFRALFGSPGTAYHLRGLAADAGVDPAHVHRLLPALIAEGLCERVDAHPHSRYRALADHPLFASLCALFSGATPSVDAGSAMRKAQARSLALHAAAVRRLKEDPSALRRARATLERWMSRYGADVPAALREWDEILSQPLDRICRLALERSEYGDRIRKSSPLSTLVSKEERRRIHAAR